MHVVGLNGGRGYNWQPLFTQQIAELVPAGSQVVEGTKRCSILASTQIEDTSLLRSLIRQTRKAPKKFGAMRQSASDFPDLDAA